MIGNIGESVAWFARRFDEHLVLFLAKLCRQKPGCAIIFGNISFLSEGVDHSLVGGNALFIRLVESMFIEK